MEWKFSSAAVNFEAGGAGAVAADGEAGLNQRHDDGYLIVLGASGGFCERVGGQVESRIGGCYSAFHGCDAPDWRM